MFVADTVQVYLAAFLQLIPFPAKVQEEIIPILPLWGLVSFGAYLLFSLGWGVATFKDTEGAYHELMKVRSVTGFLAVLRSLSGRQPTILECKADARRL